MRRVIGLIFIALVILTQGVLCGSEVESSDSLIIRPTVIKPGQSAVIEVDLVNTVELGAFTVPLYIRERRARFDSISFTGSRVDYLSTKPVTITGQGQVVIFGAVCMTEDYIPPGRGLLARLYISSRESLAESSIIIDTLTIHPASLIFAKSDSYTYIPQFIPGEITVEHSADKDKSKE